MFFSCVSTLSLNGCRRSRRARSCARRRCARSPARRALPSPWRAPLLLRELLLQDFALRALGAGAVGGRFLREAARPARAAAWGRRRHVDLRASRARTSAGRFRCRRWCRSSARRGSTHLQISVTCARAGAGPRASRTHRNRRPKHAVESIKPKKKGRAQARPSVQRSKRGSAYDGVVHVELDRMGRHAEARELLLS